MSRRIQRRLICQKRFPLFGSMIYDSTYNHHYMYHIKNVFFFLVAPLLYSLNMQLPEEVKFYCTRLFFVNISLSQFDFL